MFDLSSAAPLERGPANCASCGASLPAGARACPRCHALVHAQKIDALSSQAQKREASGDIASARELWSQALNLLPSDTTQAQWMRGHLAALPKPAHATPTWLKRLGPLGPFLLILLKGKGLFFAVFKLKFLFSLFTFVAVYWALYGWKFGIGFAASILIHEMGHYIDIKRRGLPAEMPVAHRQRLEPIRCRGAEPQFAGHGASRPGLRSGGSVATGATREGREPQPRDPPRRRRGIGTDMRSYLLPDLYLS